MNRDAITYKWAGTVLKLGMYLSFGIMSVGLVWALIAKADTQDGLLHEAVALDRLLSEVVAGNPLAVVSVGVVLLLLTPGVTLASMAISYGMERNWRFAGIAIGIGFILLLGIAISLKWIKLF